MQVRTRRDTFARDLEEGSRPECLFKFLEISKAGLLGWFRTEQRPEGAAVNGAAGCAIPDREDQGLDVRTPACFLLQVETARPRPNGLIRRKISQAVTSPISQATLSRPMRVTIATVKAPAPPRKG